MLRYVLIASLAVLAGCREEPRKAETKPAAKPVSVQAVTAAEQDWPSVYEAAGTVRARTSAIISAKVMGYVREVRFQAGDRVREGQVLAVLDARDLEANYRRAEAGRHEAESAVPEVENGIAAAQANLELAQVTFRRMDDLFKKKSISNQEYDEAAAKLKAAQAAHEMAAAKRAQIKARIAQADEERAAADVVRGYARITAPFSGVVTAKSVDPGVLATPGAPLATIEREGSYRLEVPVEESRLGSVRPGESVGVRLDVVDRELTGRISEIVPAVDAASRAYTVKIDLPAAPQIRSGAFGRGYFSQPSRPALVVPAGAVADRGQLQSVYAVDGATARLRLITTGRRAEGKVEVLSGLSAGERVVYPVPAGLADGATVEVRP